MGEQARPAITPLAIAVLALLEERPMHPYEMYQLLISRRQDLLVKVRPGSLYHAVARLSARELVRAEGVDRAGNRPERITYRITESGRTALRTRIAEIIRTPAAEYPVFPVALAEAHNLPKEDLIALLRERVEHLASDLADVEMMVDWASERGVPRRYWMVIQYLRTTLGAEVDWVTGLIVDLVSSALEWDDFDPITGDRVPNHDHASSTVAPAGQPASP